MQNFQSITRGFLKIVQSLVFNNETECVNRLSIAMGYQGRIDYGCTAVLTPR